MIASNAYPPESLTIQWHQLFCALHASHSLAAGIYFDEVRL